MKILAINWSEAFNVVGFGLLMVFIILILLVMVLTLFSNAVAPKVRIPRKTRMKNNTANISTEEDFDEDHLSADACAAIAIALHLYYAEVHDEESAIITIKNVERRYSPWSSKIYGLNNLIR